MQREKRSWGERERERGRTLSYHADQFVRPEVAAKQSSAAKEYRAALEALFEKKPEAVEKIEKIVPGVGASLPRVVATANAEPVAPNKRQELLRKITVAQGSKAISDSIEAFLAAGHTLPDDQEIFLQMLEHRDEARVREAIAQLDKLLAGQMPKRKPVLVQRLKRLEENADEDATRDAASTLRRKVG